MGTLAELEIVRLRARVLADAQSWEYLLAKGPLHSGDEICTSYALVTIRILLEVADALDFGHDP